MSFDSGLQLWSSHTKTLDCLPRVCKGTLFPLLSHSTVSLIHSFMPQILSGQSRVSTVLGTGNEMVTALSFELFSSLGKIWPVLDECNKVMLWKGWAQGSSAMPWRSACPAGFCPGGSDIYAELCKMRRRCELREERDKCDVSVVREGTMDRVQSN